MYTGSVTFTFMVKKNLVQKCTHVIIALAIFSLVKKNIHYTMVLCKELFTTHMYVMCMHNERSTVIDCDNVHKFALV